MSMLTLNGVVLNVYDTPQTTDKKTGEVRPASTRLQLQAENVLENGQKRIDLVTLKVHDADKYKKSIGKLVNVPIGAFVANGAIMYYALKESALAPS